MNLGIFEFALYISSIAEVSASFLRVFPFPVCFTGGVTLFTRSLAPLSREGIRVNVLSPEVFI